MKKWFVFCILLLISPLLAEEECPFCNLQVLDYQQFYENDLAIALYNYKPAKEGHCLIIPKRHIERYEELTEEEALEMHRAIIQVNKAVEKVFNTSTYLLLQKNGVEVGQSVPHIHVQYIPRKKGDTAVLPFILQMLTRSFFSPISSEEMRDAINRLKFETMNR